MHLTHRFTFTIAAVLLALGVAVMPASAQEAIFLVRHAERLDSSTDSPLSAEGQARAAHLAQMLGDARISVIITSEFVRTRDTARPLADRLKLPIQQIPAADVDGLLATLRAAGPRARVLVVSHGDRIPAVLAGLGQKEEVSLASGDYDNLWMILPGAGKIPMAIRLHY